MLEHEIENQKDNAVQALLRCLEGDAQGLALDDENDRATLVRLFCRELENIDG